MGKTITIKIENNQLPSFSIEMDDYVIWENLDSVAHQINSDTENPNFVFDVGILFPGESSSPVHFDTSSTGLGFAYGCGLVPNLQGRIYVSAKPIIPESTHHHKHDHGHHDHLKHFHGFVTGGRSGDRIYMTHTPIFSDERHHFQIILQASFIEETHRERYNDLRKSEYGSKKIQLFFDHLALIDIQSGTIKELTAHSLRYYPDVPTVRPRLFMPSVSTVIEEFAGAKIKIDKVLHFRTFTPEMPYPEFLTYLIYGNEDEAFIDHFISRAPNFHSVARLKSTPSFWKKSFNDTATLVKAPVMRLVEAPPKTIKRVAFLDNQFHLAWGLPSGALLPKDPLERISKRGSFEIFTEEGDIARIQISDFLHFDTTRLLNDGLGF
jgi:hypothetical protein